DLAGRDRVVVLTDALWRRRFDADPSIVGRTVVLNDEPYVVAGVLPRRFWFPRLDQILVMGISGGHPQLYIPFPITESTRTENSFATLAKVRSGVSPREATSEAAAIFKQFVQTIPNAPQVEVELVPLQRQITGASRDGLLLVWSALA